MESSLLINSLVNLSESPVVVFRGTEHVVSNNRFFASFGALDPAFHSEQHRSLFYQTLSLCLQGSSAPPVVVNLQTATSEVVPNLVSFSVNGEFVLVRFSEFSRQSELDLFDWLSPRHMVARVEVDFSSLADFRILYISQAMRNKCAAAGAPQSDDVDDSNCSTSLFELADKASWLQHFQSAVEAAPAEVSVDVSGASGCVVHCGLSPCGLHRFYVRLCPVPSEHETKLVRMQQRVSELEEALAIKSRFLAFMSHEMRTPLNGMLGSLALLSEARLDRDDLESLKIAQVCGKSLLGLVNNILDQAKMDENKMRIADP
eukprot:TRINITY_DN4286_c0_g1_i2.p1 TRINITY_DN4286_c0_g1~~TRINITY_DN4286_c0_g1_i2.p1  ORF type:complete len:317 (+),score=60.08 TRINITY_DN4286_c0_g1_i2:127-1077(+)